jgi:hypothetical protein
MNEKSITVLPLLAGIALFLVEPAGNTFAQDDAMHDDVIQFEEIRNLGSLSCRDILLASGGARENLVLVLHAYLLGEAKELEFNAMELAEATDRFLNACIAEPDAQALQTLRNELG